MNTESKKAIVSLIDIILVLSGIIYIFIVAYGLHEILTTHYTSYIYRPINLEGFCVSILPPFLLWGLYQLREIISDSEIDHIDE